MYNEDENRYGFSDEYDGMQGGSIWQQIGFLICILFLILLLWPIMLIVVIVSAIRDNDEEEHQRRPITNEDREAYENSKPEKKRNLNRLKKRKIKLKRKSKPLRKH